jgi:glucosamine-6-phosphate deaminase
VRIRLFESPERVARTLARELARAIERDPRLVMGLPTGRTPVPLYRELAALYEAGRVDFSQVTTFNLDEFVGVAPGGAGSYRSFMQRNLFDRINVSPRRTNFLDGSAIDPAGECARFERAIRRAGGIDLMVLGLGTNGHIGFNEPADALAAETHRTRLKAATRRANAPLFDGRLRDVPHEGLSMGMGTILRARRIVLLVTGRSKAACVRRALYGPVTTRVPASFLQLHAGAELWMDRTAASHRDVR